MSGRFHRCGTFCVIVRNVVDPRTLQLSLIPGLSDRSTARCWRNWLVLQTDKCAQRRARSCKRHEDGAAGAVVVQGGSALSTPGARSSSMSRAQLFALLCRSWAALCHRNALVTINRVLRFKNVRYGQNPAYSKKIGIRAGNNYYFGIVCF